MNKKTRFQDHVTGMAFSLTLSKSMILSLCYAVRVEEIPFGLATDTAEGYIPLIEYPGTGANSWGALERRGLVEYTDIPCHHPQFGKGGSKVARPTEAAYSVYEMLLVADLVPNQFLPIHKRRSANGD